jgi:Concanavalin A-like lectin/glucanases superfamily/Secretion system C-terminal sorting domain
LWAKWGGQNSWFPGIISKCSIVNQGWYIVINSSSLDSISFQGGISSGNYFNVSSAPLLSNQWVNIVGVYSNGVQKLYINGVLQDININSGLFPNNSEDIHIGLKNGDAFWNGAIDEVAIWNRELSQIEVNQIFNGCNLSFLQQPQSLTLLSGQAGQLTALSSVSSASYQWQFNGGLGWQNLSNAGAFSGVNSSTLTVIANSSLNNFLFRCIVSDAACTDTSSIATLIINGSVSIMENSNENFEINPNPARNFLLISNLYSGSQYKIFDSSGRLIKFGIPEIPNSQIDINNLNSGFYVIQINNSKRKFVKY